MDIGFDNEKYLKVQTESILKRAERFKGGKLYLEIGGKLIWDMHASRVLPGFDPCVKMRVFSGLTDKIDVILCISAISVEEKKIRGDFGIGYDADIIKTIDEFARWGLKCDKVVITRYNGQQSAERFKGLLERRGVHVYLHRSIPNYPQDIDTIASPEGFGMNPYIETDPSKPIVLVNAPGPGSGKLATCLSQIYHDSVRGTKSGYAKFETFPIWNLTVDHPVNIAYEAATADIGDFNMIDHFYVAANEGKKIAVNYNRDVEAFPVLKRLLEKVSDGAIVYTSPTDMGVNQAGNAISDDSVCRQASNQEIIRRCLIAQADYAQGLCSQETVLRSTEIMRRCGLSEAMRPTVSACMEKLNDAINRKKGKEGIVCTAAMQLSDGRFVTGCNSSLMHAATALVFNALKMLCGIDENELLLPSEVINSVKEMKKNALKEKGTSLNLAEGLICLALSAPKNPLAKQAVGALSKLSGNEVHFSHIPSDGDMRGLRKLGLRVTSRAKFPSPELEAL